MKTWQKTFVTIGGGLGAGASAGIYKATASSSLQAAILAFWLAVAAIALLLALQGWWKRSIALSLVSAGCSAIAHIPSSPESATVLLIAGLALAALGVAAAIWAARE